jgi:hypothetical protein
MRLARLKYCAAVRAVYIKQSYALRACPYPFCSNTKLSVCSQRNVRNMDLSCSAPLASSFSLCSAPPPMKLCVYTYLRLWSCCFCFIKATAADATASLGQEFNLVAPASCCYLLPNCCCCCAVLLRRQRATFLRIYSGACVSFRTLHKKTKGGDEMKSDFALSLYMVPLSFALSP